MIAPLTHSIPERELLPDIRAVLSLKPYLAYCPEALAALLLTDEHKVRAILEVLRVEGEILA